MSLFSFAATFVLFRHARHQQPYRDQAILKAPQLDAQGDVERKLDDHGRADDT